MKKAYFLSTAGVVLIVGLLLVIYFFVIKSSDKSAFSDIQKKVGFTIFLPDQKTGVWVVNESSIVMNNDTGVLTYSVNKSDNTNDIVITEQATPDPFNDVPNYSSIFLSKLNQYQQLNIPLGTAALTHPSELKGGQSAVLNVRGTLMFMHPKVDLSDDNWKDFLKTLQAV